MIQRRFSIDFDLRQLEIFQKVVDLRSFRKAAEAVHLAQASVSERIANLESQVGARLLDRLGRKVVPTRAGEVLYKHAALLLDMKRTACQEMEGFLGLRKGQVQVGASTIPGEYILPATLGGFCRQYPSVSVILTISDTRGIEKSVLSGDLEMGVVGSRGQEKSLVSHELWQDELVVVAPSGHEWSERQEIPLETFVREPFLFREKGSGTFHILDGCLQRAGLRGVGDLKPVAFLGSSTAIKEGVKAGLGVSVLSRRAVDTEVRAGLISVLRLQQVPLFRRFYLIRDRRRIASPLCQVMMDFLLTHARNQENDPQPARIP